ncbi:Hpt domain-containing protein, partial [Escherichia coli]|uniref:Hpt domain-containing protein n=1 Tax=Escherichia coli TaxID=562 RepID=UPI001485270A
IARASQDNEKIKRAAHQLKSSCPSLGMRSASQKCQKLAQQPLSAPHPHQTMNRSLTNPAVCDILKNRTTSINTLTKLRTNGIDQTVFKRKKKKKKKKTKKK